MIMNSSKIQLFTKYLFINFFFHFNTNICYKKHSRIKPPSGKDALPVELRDPNHQIDQYVARSTQISEEQVCCIVMLYILEYGGNVVDRHSKRLIHSYLKDIGEDIRNGVKQKAQEILLCVESSYTLEQDSF